MTPLPITVCVVAGNEAGRIRRTLESVQGWTAELVLAIDDKVHDGTDEVARSFGARVICQPWRGHAVHRNFASAHATQPWLLAIDADEVISPELRAEISAVFTAPGGPTAAAYSFPRLSFLCGRWIRHGDWYPDRKVRLWRHTAGEWQGNPHEKLVVNGPVVPLRSDLLHFSNENIDQLLSKISVVSGYYVRHRSPGAKRPGWLHLTVRPAWKFFRGYVIKRGFLDGWPGFLIASINAFSTVVRYTKVMEAELDPGPPPTHSSR